MCKPGEGITQTRQPVQRVHLKGVDLTDDELGIAHGVRVEHDPEEGGAGVGCIVATRRLPDDALRLAGIERPVVSTKGVLLPMTKLLNLNSIKKNEGSKKKVIITILR